MKRLMLCAMALMGAGALFAEDSYVQSDGTQSINTGYYVNAKTKIEIDFQMTEITSQGRLWGQNGTGCGNMAVVYFGDTANNFKIGYGNANFSGAFLAANNLERNTIIYDGPGNKGYLYQNGTQVLRLDGCAQRNRHVPDVDLRAELQRKGSIGKRSGKDEALRFQGL